MTFPRIAAGTIAAGTAADQLVGDGFDRVTKSPRKTSAIDNTSRELCGVVERIVFSSPDSSWCVMRLRSGDTICGEVEAAAIDTQVAYRFYGRWKEHPRHGMRFLFDSITYDTQPTRAGVIKYLDRVTPHVTAAKAARLWDKYGADAVMTLRTDPARVIADGILHGDQAAAAAADLERLARSEKTRIDLYDLFGGRGFPRKTVDAVIDRWGGRAPSLIRRDPFRLLTAKISGVGFNRADKLYLDLQLRPDRLKRQMLAGWYAIHSNGDGDTWFREGILRAAVCKAAGGMSKSRFEAAIQLGLRSGWLEKATDTNGCDWYTTKRRAMAERQVAAAVARLMRHPAVIWPDMPSDIMSAHQLEQVRPILRSPFAILTGCPGVGKTYVAAAILRRVVHHYGVSGVVVLAPTGKAAVRITEAMSKYDLPLAAKTIHRYLGVQRQRDDGFDFNYTESHPYNAKIIVCDEMSMADIELAAALFSAAPAGTHFLIIGDKHQLPPVSHGAVLRDLIYAGVPTAELTEIQRNSGLIVESCHRIKDGKKMISCQQYVPPTDNLRFIQIDDPVDQVATLRHVVDHLRTRYNQEPATTFDPTWGVQVLVARNDSTPVSRRPINKILQAVLNPCDNPAWRSDSHQFRRGDKIICLKNTLMPLVALRFGGADDVVDDYDAEHAGGNGIAADTYIANGDMGRVEAVADRKIVVTFLNPSRTVKLDVKPQKRADHDVVDEDQAAAAADGGDSNGGSADGGGSGNDFDLAYAITTHKSQGSEWPCVVVMIDDAAGRVVSREHIYTSISRAKSLCVLIGRRTTADKYCTQPPTLDKRKTFLRQLIEQRRQGPRLADGRFSSRVPALKQN